MIIIKYYFSVGKPLISHITLEFIDKFRIKREKTMSVIQELFENYDHIPLEFKRQLTMMRELDELC